MTTSQRARPKSSRKGGRPTQESATALRENLLNSALDIFLLHGYGGASLNQIAKTAGVSRDTIYRQFSDKRELFRVATRSAFSNIAKNLEEVVKYEGPVEEVLKKVIRYIYLDTHDDRSSSIIRLIFMESYRFPELREDWASQTIAFFSPLINYLDTQASKGNLSIIDPAESAMLIAIAASGGVNFYVGEPHLSEEEITDRVDRILEFLLYGLKNGRP